MTTDCVLEPSTVADRVAPVGRTRTDECSANEYSSAATLSVSRSTDLPCQAGDADLWFAEDPRDLERAKAFCGDCPLKAQCLQAALDRAEPWGVWGGEIFDHGAVIARKRPRGRPRKNAA
ncbi:WhiB family transcriptional regulator [Gordonia sp. NB41Y]|uniref:WhiB family transcriptional regulator n=1 Tax=Gordonia sp. NB41Y TaxID=875808 RepID=UPI0002BFB7E8|nr:WhiB family transcriptional regulator [Gordonia sp. NB41Y]EMP11967.1 transcription factor WhiB [Gordonia sp. NB41Y]WLP89880.1 WhiB family transcriptional regulator [Gordonia sp. NB41Y]